MAELLRKDPPPLETAGPAGQLQGAISTSLVAVIASHRTITHLHFFGLIDQRQPDVLGGFCFQRSVSYSSYFTAKNKSQLLTLALSILFRRLFDIFI